MDILIAIMIHLGVPLIGLQVYLWLCRRIKGAGIRTPPHLPLLLLFVSYGGWLMVILTKLFWYWSGMASLGLAYLLLIAPIIMAIIAVIMFGQRRESQYHLWAFIGSAGYTVMTSTVLLAGVLLKNG